MGIESWKNESDPCGSPAWASVTWDASGAVVRLDLYDINRSLTSDIAALAPLVWLTYLSLGWTKMAGDVKGPLAPLVQLTYLRLNVNTNMTGDIKDLAPLVQLTTLDLSYTAVAGDVKDPPTPLVPPTGLFY